MIGVRPKMPRRTKERSKDCEHPGSFDEVAAAYHRGDISIDDYRTLAEAAAESMRDEEERNG